MAKGRYPKIDQFVGARIRERRIMLGMSQRALAKSIGLVTQQMIFKYELGIDAVSASRLFEIAGALGTSVDYFFEGFEAKEVTQIPPHQPILLNLMRDLGEIDSEVHLEAISHLIRALAIPDAPALKGRPVDNSQVVSGCPEGNE